jgi:hypothetical protein
MKDSESNSRYKKLRNKLKRIPLEDMLLFTWAFDRYLNYNQNLPSEIPHSKYYNSLKGDSIDVWIAEGIQPWLIDILFREYITHYNEDNTHDRSILQGNRILDTINQIPHLSDSIIKDYKEKDPLQAQSYFWRLQYQQFTWQDRDLPRDLLRYYILYSDEDLTEEIKRIIDPSFDIKNILLLGGLLWHTYQNHFWIKWPIQSSEITILTPEVIDYFCKTFTKPFKELCEDARLTPRVTEDFEFKFNPLQRYPLIVVNDRLYCPETVLLLDMITKGLKYIILEHDIRGPVNQRFGLVFENYCYNLTKYYLSKKLNVYKDAPTKTKNGTPRTVDIIMKDKESSLFIECKSGYINKSSDKDSYKKAINQIAIYLEEAYNSLTYYKNNLYPQLRYDKKSFKNLLIVILDDIYMLPSFDRKIFEKNIVQKILEISKDKNHNIEQGLFKEIPWHICGIKQYEFLIGNLKELSIKDTFTETITETSPVLRTKKVRNINLGDVFGISNNVFQELSKKVKFKTVNDEN